MASAPVGRNGTSAALVGLNTLFVCQKQAKGPTHVIVMDLDNRMVTFQTDRTPQDRIAVRF